MLSAPNRVSMGPDVVRFWAVYNDHVLLDLSGHEIGFLESSLDQIEGEETR